jgi:hypothetical protein
MVPEPRSTCQPLRASEPQNQFERFVDGALFVGRDSTDERVQSAEVDGPQLLDQHARGFAGQLYAGPERGGSGAPRGGCYDDS